MQQISNDLKKAIKDLYKNLNIGFVEVNGDNEGYNSIIKMVLEHLEFMKKEPGINE